MTGTFKRTLVPDKVSEIEAIEVFQASPGSTVFIAITLGRPPRFEMGINDVRELRDILDEIIRRGQ